MHTSLMTGLQYVKFSSILSFRMFLIKSYSLIDFGQIKPLNHSHALPTPDRNGVTYICSCMIFLRPTNGAKLLMKQWIKELQSGSKAYEGNDQPAFNWALNKTAHQVLFIPLISIGFVS